VSPTEPDPLPRGLVFFPRPTPRRLRRARIAFALFAAVAGAALVWPLYPLFGGIRPMILGLPLSLAWVVLWLALVFVALLVLYRVEHGGGDGGSGGTAEEPR
jgi:hypothetical protein